MKLMPLGHVEEQRYSYIFLISTLDGGEWSASCPGCFNSSTHWIRGYLGLRACLDNEEKKISCPFLESNPNSSAIQSMARSSYLEYLALSIFSEPLFLNAKGKGKVKLSLCLNN
jgi:hypothetical protein